MTDNSSAAIQDYTAAMNEIRSNLDVRRLMLIVSHILVPALAVAMTDCMTGSDYPPEIAWLPRYIIPIVGITLAVAGSLVTGVLARCHFGLVVNGSKMHRISTGTFTPQPLNWLGVTTNFTALTALSAGAGLWLFLVSLKLDFLSLVCGPALSVVLVLYLRVAHWRANRLCQRLEANWQQGDVPAPLRENHARQSLEATTSDISVIVTMGVALFAGTFNSMTNVGGISPDLKIALPVSVVREWGVVALAGYTLLSLLLSGRMVVRLRIALAEHSSTLSKLRQEPDDPYRFKPLERTFLLFLLQHLITSVACLILLWSLAGMTAGMIAAAALMVLGAGWYPVTVVRARRSKATSLKGFRPN